MSKKYEALIILKSQAEQSVDELVQIIGKKIEDNGAQLDEIKNLGRKDFAYPQKHISGGVYVNYGFTAEANVIKELQAVLTLEEGVHLQHYRAI